MRLAGLLVRWIATLVLIWAQINLQSPAAERFMPDQIPPDTAAQLDWLRDALADDAATEMQSAFAEGYVFTWVLYGLTQVQLGLRYPTGSAERIAAESEARRALTMLHTPEARRPFEKMTDPPLGAFYLGWTNWLRGGLLLLQVPNARADEVKAFNATCATIALALRQHGPFVPSYPGKRWPVDTVVAAASLRLHDSIQTPKYTKLLTNWMGHVDDRLDADGLIPHAVGPTNASGMRPARGSSQALMLRFFYEIDPERTRKWYRTVRQKFVTTKLGLPAMTEYPGGKDGPSDVDSGPLIAGASAPAMVVNIGTAMQLGDRPYVESMISTIELVGMPLPGKRYAFGLLPVGDAFLAWSKSARPFTRPSRTEVYSPIVSEWFRWPWHLVFGFFLLLLWLGPIRRWVRGARA
ncbi:MAG: hypothetical protein ACI9U2_001390 [Bradymonadia bacterium]|jgi:hypothetical protein